MATRKIKVTVSKDGTLKFDNAGNSDETRILRELGELAELLTGNKQGFEIEAHTHSHLVNHTHGNNELHTH